MNVSFCCEVLHFKNNCACSDDLIKLFVSRYLDIRDYETLFELFQGSIKLSCLDLILKNSITSSHYFR